MASGGSLHFPFEKLRGRENFDVWKRHAKSYLILKGCWKVTENELPTPTTPKDVELDERALAEITLMLEPTNFAHIADAEHAHDAWKALMKAFEVSGLTRKVDLLKSLVHLKLDQFPSVQEYISTVVMTSIKVKNAGLNIDEEITASLMLAGLPAEFRPLVLAVENSNDKLTVETVKQLLMQDSKFDNSIETEKALQLKNIKVEQSAKYNQQKNSYRCYNCNQTGHISKWCKKNKNNKYQRSSTNNNQSLLVAMLASKTDDEWYIDSGATSHMTNNKELLTNEMQIKKEVIVASGEKLQVQSAGNIQLELNNKNENISAIAKNVDYVPNLCTNLLSVRQMTKNNNTVVFKKNICEIYNSEHNLIGTASVVNDLYKLNCKTNSEQKSFLVTSKFDLWHRRLGHICDKNLNLVKNASIGINYENKNKDSCIVCLKGKQTRSISKNVGNRAKNLLDLVHSDVMGPLNTVSFGGARFLLIFVDDYSRKVFAVPIKRKSDVFEQFVIFKKLVENQCNRKIKVLRTDNGTEYVNQQFKSFMQKSGIIHQKTAPYTPEQNGVAERMNRNIIERVRCMLIDSGLCNEFWAEAANTAVHIINRIPCRDNEKSPQEIWTGIKPKLNYLKIFGCTAMVHVPKQKRTKLDAKSVECYFAGYSEESKAYRLYEKSTLKFVISRDVHFIESDIKSDKHHEHNIELVTNIYHENSVNTFEINDNENNNNNINSVFTIDIQNENSSSDVANSKEEICDDLPTITEINTSEDDFESPDSSLNDEMVISDRQETIIDLDSSIRRSERIARKPKRSYIFYALEGSEDPMNVKDALKGNEADEWMTAMKTEFDALQENKTWVLTDLPKGKKAISTKWVFKTKTNANGELICRKARLVARGFSQEEGVDYNETFSPVVRYSSLRFLFSMAAKYKLLIQQMDAVTAFLNGELKEEIFINQPECFDDGSGRVCRLKKSLYGLKQSSRVWNIQLNQTLIDLDLKRSEIDQCIYYKRNAETMIYVAIYVDDILIFSNNMNSVTALKQQLSNKFKMTDIGEATSVLGIRVEHQKSGNIKLDQSEYILGILKRFGMSDCNPISTPVDTNQKLTNDMCPTTAEELKQMEKVPYMEAIGCLLFAAQNTRPDICFAVNMLSRFSTNPGIAHWTAVKRVMRYLKGTINHGIIYETQPSNMVGYCDADWGGDVDERRSTSGYVFLCQGAAVSWYTHRQRTVALSSTEAEYMALVAAMQESIWLKNLEAELIAGETQTMIIHCDNKSAIQIAQNNNFSPRTKHIDIKAKFIREKLESGQIALKYIPTTEMLADALTKAVPAPKHQFINEKLGLK